MTGDGGGRSKTLLELRRKAKKNTGRDERRLGGQYADHSIFGNHFFLNDVRKKRRNSY